MHELYKSSINVHDSGSDTFVNVEEALYSDSIA